MEEAVPPSSLRGWDIKRACRVLGLGQARWLRCKTPLSRMNLKNTIFPWLITSGGVGVIQQMRR